MRLPAAQCRDLMVGPEGSNGERGGPEELAIRLLAVLASANRRPMPSRCACQLPRVPTRGCGPSKAALLEARAGIEPAYTALQAAA